jgi:hypothetical protein
LGWTQSELAEYANVDDAVISRMERGVKKYFEPELLFCLANALQLTTMERREFIFAASGLDESQIVRQPSASMVTDVFDAQKILDRMVSLAGKIRVPSFIVDVFGDVVAANYMMLAFYDVPSSMIETAAQIPGGYVRLNFGRDRLARNHVSENWDTYALNSMRAFRESSIRYRAHPYLKYLLKSFRNPTEYPFFERFWKLISSTEQDKEVNTDHFSYNHSRLGPLNYIATTTIAITSSGNLFLVQNLPLDDHTEDVFDQLKSQAGLGVMRFASWPEKLIPTK